MHKMQRAQMNSDSFGAKENWKLGINDSINLTMTKFNRKFTQLLVLLSSGNLPGV